MTLDKAIADALRAASTATLTTVLLKKGIRRCWMKGPMPAFHASEKMVGRAFTLRFVPAREDLATPESWSSPISTRAAIEAMPEGCIAVADAMGVTDAGFPGDIIVVDDDGAVCIPQALVEEVAKAGEEQERLEAWILGKVMAGETLPG